MPWQPPSVVRGYGQLHHARLHAILPSYFPLLLLSPFSYKLIWFTLLVDMTLIRKEKGDVAYIESTYVALPLLISCCFYILLFISVQINSACYTDQCGPDQE